MYRMCDVNEENAVFFLDTYVAVCLEEKKELTGPEFQVIVHFFLKFRFCVAERSVLFDCKTVFSTPPLFPQIHPPAPL